MSGVRVVELAGIGPGPFCGMVLADLGADVVRIERPNPPDPEDAAREHLNRGRRSIALDLKQATSVELVLQLVERADVLFEGFRPGVAERLGIGPVECHARNPKLVYGRMTGYGQDGPLASSAGHDINYIALSGALHAIGRPGERPVPPLNLVGDFGGGGMLLVVGVLAALADVARSGRGEVVDAAMVDGSALLMAMQSSLLAQGLLEPGRGTNILDGGAPYYDTYETSDGGYVAVGAIEPQFYEALVEGLGLDAASLPDRDDRSSWPELRERFTVAFRSASRSAWEERFAGADACVSPVLSLEEAAAHPHNRARGTFVDPGNGVQPAPAPRFSSTPRSLPDTPPSHGADLESVLDDWLEGPGRGVPATEVRGGAGMNGLAGRVVAVTGSGRGIGREHALLLASLGARVVVNDIGEAADEVVAEITAAGGAAVADHHDITEWDGAEALVDAAVVGFGRLDALVNNAGIVRDRLIANLEDDEWDAVVRVHLRGHAAALRAAARHWRGRAKAGEDVRAAVVNTTSTSGLLGNAGQGSYGAAKAGIATLSTIAAMELGRYGVRVNCIAPAARTRLTEEVPGMEDMVRKPDGDAFDVWDPANVSPMVAYLVSDECDLSGLTFFVLGGRVQLFRPWWPGPMLLEGRRWTVDELAERIPGFVAAHHEPVPDLEGL